MAYNKNIEDEFPLALPPQLSKISNLTYQTTDNREISIVLNDYITLQKSYISDGLYLEGKDLFKYILKTNYLQNHNNVTHINFFLFDYTITNVDYPFLCYRELREDENHTISYEIDLEKMFKDLQEDINGNQIPFFKICSEYKFTAIKENFKIINDVLDDIGISYKVIYMPSPYFPEYINQIPKITANSPFVYGMDFEEFKEKYHHDFHLNSNISKNIDTISCKDEISWLSSKYYEDVYRVQNIIKDINPLVEFGLGIDFYTHFGNYCHDKLLLKDANLYSNFQEQILFNKDFMYPFADFLYIDCINYDYCIKPNSKDDPEMSLVDIRTINERLNLVCARYKYPLNKIEIGFLKAISGNDDLSFLNTINKGIFSFSPYSLISLMNDEKISRRFPKYLYETEDTSSKENYEIKKKVNSFLVEEKSSILDYLKKIYLIPTTSSQCNIPFNLSDYNGMLLYRLRLLGHVE